MNDVVLSPPVPAPCSSRRPEPLAATARVGTAERERTASVLGEAFALGYLSMPEYESRLEEAFQAKTVGDLEQVAADIPVEAMRRGDPRRVEARRAAARRGVSIHAAIYVAVALVSLVVWGATAVAFGAWYFWPIWVLVGGGLGLASHAAPAGMCGRARTGGRCGR